ncbi:MAG: protein kinase [Acidobacteriia bacterium]|nr:protein kinase [Terriglobia bacterium]
MSTLETVGDSSQTLAQRMAKGRLPVPEALRYGMILTEAVRRIHESGQAHGAIAPSCIAISRTGLDLLPAVGSMELVTPYTAPEVLRGNPADSRSDIFSIGVILYEMLTGRGPFQGGSLEALSAAILNSAPPPSGSPAVDRMVANCVAKDPAARWQRAQKLLMELKLLSVAVRRSEAIAPVRREPDPAMLAEMQQMESRFASRMAQVEQSIAAFSERLSQVEQVQRSTSDRVSHVEQTLQSTSARVSGVEEIQESTGDRVAGVELMQRSTGERVSQVEQAQQSTVDRVDRMEHAVNSVRQDAAEARDALSEDRAPLERSLKSQAAAIESVKTAVAQTDDLVERVVEALESWQSVVLDHSRD